MKKDDFQDFYGLIRFAGSRFDLTQAGGGNISMKCDNVLYIKPSGISIADIDSIEECAQVNVTGLKSSLENIEGFTNYTKQTLSGIAEALLNENNILTNRKPSIETFFHVWGKKYTLHTHPILVNSLLISKNAKAIIDRLFPHSMFVDYYTPGLDLALQIYQKSKEYVLINGSYPEIIFLKNHGLIVNSNTKQEVVDNYNNIVELLSKKYNIATQKYLNSNEIADKYFCLTQKKVISYLTNDITIINLIERKSDFIYSLPTFPDQCVYNGIKPCLINEIAEFDNEVKKFIKVNLILPTLIIHKENAYFIARNIRKALEMEHVFRSHLEVLQFSEANVDYLEFDECLYLKNWESEKYRQAL